MAENRLELVLSTKTSKKEKEQAYRYGCALLNSDGGTLILKTKARKDDIIRAIEQNMKKIIGSAISRRFNCKSTEEGFELKVKGQEQLCTMNYNAYLPSETQKIPVEPHEVQQMKELLREDRIVDITEAEDRSPLSFTHGQPIGTQESKTVQFKHITSEKSDLATSLFNNDLNRYVSAFANSIGGTLYCGVKDDGIVEGQILKVNENVNEQENFRTKVDEYVNKMIWPENIGSPVKLGPKGQLDILFEPVIDQDGTPMSSRFVVVITVPVCPGGVFCNKPESYHVFNGEVKDMEFVEWKRRLRYSNRSRPLVSNIPLCEWNSLGTRSQCDKLDGEMLRKINNGEWDKFKIYAAKLGTDLEKQLVVLSKWAMYYYRKNEFDKAVQSLEQLDDKLAKAHNVMIFEVRQKLVFSALERSRGDHKRSYEIAEELLPKVEQLAPSILTAEFYVHFATMLTIIEGNDELKKKLNKDVRPGYWRSQAIEFYDRSLQHLENIKYVPQSIVDMQQKAYINLAILRLGCSLSGDVVNEKVTNEDLQGASTCLRRASEIEFDSKLKMTGFRSCHFSFAKAFTCYRTAQHEKDEEMRAELLEDAVRLANDTELLAEKYEFKELSAYARAHAKLFQEELNNSIGEPE